VLLLLVVLLLLLLWFPAPFRSLTASWWVSVGCQHDWQLAERTRTPSQKVAGKDPHALAASVQC
jgi:hypothetical protein